MAGVLRVTTMRCIQQRAQSAALWQRDRFQLPEFDCPPHVQKWVHSTVVGCVHSLDRVYAAELSSLALQAPSPQQRLMQRQEMRPCTLLLQLYQKASTA